MSRALGEGRPGSPSASAAWQMKGTHIALGGFRLLQGNSCSVIMLIFNWFLPVQDLLKALYSIKHCIMALHIVIRKPFVLLSLLCLWRGVLTSPWLLQLLSSFYICGSRTGEGNLTAVFRWVSMWLDTFVCSFEFSNQSGFELLKSNGF